jgi:hypothetical protein
MERVVGRKYRAPFFKILLLIYPIVLVLGIVGMLTDPTVKPLDYLYYALAVLPIAALPCVLILAAYPVSVSDGGLLTKPQAFKSQFTGWNNILKVKPQKFLFLHCVKLTCAGNSAALWLPLDMQQKSRYIEDLKQSAPAGNPLRVYLESGELVECMPGAESVPGSESDASPMGMTPAEKDLMDRRKLETGLRSGASWFFFIGGMSAANSIAMLAGINWAFVIGLAATQFIDGVATGVMQGVGGSTGIVIRFISIIMDLFIACVFVLLGVFARKKQGWCFITGMVFYALDSILCILFQDYLALAIHLLALWGIFRGYRACKQLKKP